MGHTYSKVQISVSSELTSPKSSAQTVKIEDPNIRKGYVFRISQKSKEEQTFWNPRF